MKIVYLEIQFWIPEWANHFYTKIQMRMCDFNDLLWYSNISPKNATTFFLIFFFGNDIRHLAACQSHIVYSSPSLSAQSTEKIARNLIVSFVSYIDQPAIAVSRSSVETNRVNKTWNWNLHGNSHCSDSSGVSAVTVRWVSYSFMQFYIRIVCASFAVRRQMTPLQVWTNLYREFNIIHAIHSQSALM